LEALDISGSYFSGSLEPLKNLTKLRELDISNTDIDSGLEYLPDSIKEIKCFSSQEKDARVATLAKELEKYEKDELDLYDSNNEESESEEDDSDSEGGYIGIGNDKNLIYLLKF